MSAENSSRITRAASGEIPAADRLAEAAAEFDLLADGHLETLLWVWGRGGVRLRAASRCQSDALIDDGHGNAVRCRRPIWGDGYVNGQYYGMCSKCWHQWAAFHSHYTFFQANPAAAHLTDANIDRLRFFGKDHLPEPEPGEGRAAS